MRICKIVRAGEAFDRADEVEDFQAVGMRCRECLLALVRELANDGDFDGEGGLPKAGDFKGWADHIAGSVASGLWNACAHTSRRLPMKLGN